MCAESSKYGGLAKTWATTNDMTTYHRVVNAMVNTAQIAAGLRSTMKGRTMRVAKLSSVKVPE